MGGESGIRLELDGVHAVDAVQATGQSCGGRHAQAEDGCSRRKGGESGIDYGAFGASASLRQLGLGGESGIRLELDGVHEVDGVQGERRARVVEGEHICPQRRGAEEPQSGVNTFESRA